MNWMRISEAKKEGWGKFFLSYIKWSSVWIWNADIYVRNEESGWQL